MNLAHATVCSASVAAMEFSHMVCPAVTRLSLQTVADQEHQQRAYLIYQCHQLRQNLGIPPRFVPWNPGLAAHCASSQSKTRYTLWRRRRTKCMDRLGAHSGNSH